MTIDEKVEERRRKIQELQARADALMKSEIDSSVKVDVVEGIRDLREASAWLNEALKNSGAAVAQLGFADFRIDIASRRLDFIDNALRTYGPTLRFFR